MQLGWIDFSKNERNKVLSVIHQLEESAAVDEVGLGAIRDGFADYFFPGNPVFLRQGQKLFREHLNSFFSRRMRRKRNLPGKDNGAVQPEGRENCLPEVDENTERTAAVAV